MTGSHHMQVYWFASGEGAAAGGGPGVLEEWQRRSGPGAGREPLLLHPDGRLEFGAFARLLGQRQNRSIELVE